MISQLSMSHYLKKLSKKQRDIIAKKIGIVLHMLHSDDFGGCYPSLDQCYMLLGRMQTRLRMLQFVVERMNYYLTYGHGVLIRWPKELHELRETSKKQIGLMEKLIDCYLAKGGTVWADIEKKEESNATV